MDSLPPVTDPDFRPALRTARTARHLSYSELARRAGISPVMPSRYENANHSNATLPNQETWRKLNEVLFPEGGEALPDRIETDSLASRSLEDLVAELKRRGVRQVTLSL